MLFGITSSRHQIEFMAMKRTDYFATFTPAIFQWCPSMWTFRRESIELVFVPGNTNNFSTKFMFADALIFKKIGMFNFVPMNHSTR